MKIKQKKSQLTIFLILGIVMVTILLVLVLLGRQSIKKTSKQEITDIGEITFDIQPINNFVTECLSIISKDGLKKIGNQGGYLCPNQGGTLPEGYCELPLGRVFVIHGDSKVFYNIDNDISQASVNSHPTDIFPYTDLTLSQQNFEYEGAFGGNILPALNKSFGPHSIQTQLTSFVEKNIDGCLDFSLFKGFNITKNDKEIKVDIHDDDVVFRMEYPIIINNLVSGEKTEIKNFLVRHKVRVGKLHRFVNKLIEDDISDIKFDILNGNQDFDVNIERNVFENDDLIIVIDQKSSIDNLQYEYYFARKNRNPSMFFLTPDEITLPKFTEITSDVLVPGFPEAVQVLDPDEDSLDPTSFSIKLGEQDTPINIFCIPELTFTVKVTDGELEDFQNIKVTNTLEGCS
ncbi:hypothetical protein JYT91_01320 [archaeon AH-315-M20]|nr:hypothetical protein [archaeon AH-315-M20]